MKPILGGAAVVLATAAVASPAGAQLFTGERPHPGPLPHEHVELAPAIGYVFPGSVGVTRGVANVDGAAELGAAVDIGDWYGARLELSYTQQSSNLEATPASDAPPTRFGLDVHHFAIGGELDILSGPVRPFIGGAIGAALFVPHATLAQDEWRFQASAETGAKVMFSPNTGLRVQALVTTVVVENTSHIFCNGVCFERYGFIDLTQVAVTAGPMVAF